MALNQIKLFHPMVELGFENWPKILKITLLFIFVKTFLDAGWRNVVFVHVS